MFAKHFCTGSQGGIVFTKDGRLYKKVRRASDRGKPYGLPDGSTNCIASLNFNLGDLGATIGRVQLRKLPEIVRRRQQIAAAIAEGLKDSRAVSMPEKVAGADPSYWFLRLRFNRNAVSCDKGTFCGAVSAEGVPVSVDYKNMPHTYDWIRGRHVFASSGYPWASPHYKGDPNREFPCPNALKAIADHFLISIHENWGEEEVADTLAAILKVEAAYMTV